MTPFEYLRGDTVDAALRACAAHCGGNGTDHVRPPAQYLAGGTNLLDLMKIGVMQPEVLVDINALGDGCRDIRVEAAGLHLGALARMSEVSEHPAVKRDYPAIHDALWQAASPQLRNMGSMAGNALQRTRCNYFRDVSWPCNKREPGTGCSAKEGRNRRLAVLGVSEHCIASYPGDLGHVLAAFGATLDVVGLDGQRRTLAFEELHRLPGDTPHIETNLHPGDLITAFHVPAGPWTRRSLYLKIRDRASYEFALASAVVGLDLDGETVREARIGLGGVTARPWRSHEAEQALRGRRLDEATAMQAADAAFAGAVTHGDNAFKPELGRRTLVRALLEAANLQA